MLAIGLSRRRRYNPPAMRIRTALKWGVLIASAMMLSGCMAAALAPAGVQALETLGISAGNSISGKNSDEEKLDDETESADCQQLTLAVPYIAEVRTGPDGATSLRRWATDVVKGEQRWVVVHDASTDGEGWQSGAVIGRLNFNPPLDTALSSSGSRYMISALADPGTAFEANQLLSLTVVFGPREGTYDWNGKRYDYAVAKKLPCFPGASPDSTYR